MGRLPPEQRFQVQEEAKRERLRELEKRVRDEELAGCTFRPQIGTLPASWEYARRSPGTSQGELEALTSPRHAIPNQDLAGDHRPTEEDVNN
jgi:hypothetical protein|tara:strand:- start:12 stop:287 length:276 start_codon:yes stop_codon:yes gene_type:complete